MENNNYDDGTNSEPLEMLSLIGQGGMADVYKAKDTILNRICGNQSSA